MHLPSLSFTRSVTKLLEDLVYFVVDIPSSAQDVLEITVNKPNRERQKTHERAEHTQTGTYYIMS